MKLWLAVVLAGLCLPLPTVMPAAFGVTTAPTAAVVGARANLHCAPYEVAGIPGFDHGRGGVEVERNTVACKTELLTAGTAGITPRHGAGAQFGAAIAIDENTDQLAIGEPGRTVAGHRDAGGVQILYWGDNGYVAGPLITRSTPGVPGSPKTGERLGSALLYQASSPAAHANVLFVGVPGAKGGSSGDPLAQAGEVLGVKYPTTRIRWTKPISVVGYLQGVNVGGTPSAGAHLGAVLGANEKVGAPDETVDGHKGAGFWGTLGDYADGGWGQGTETGEHLGASIADATTADQGDDPKNWTFIGAPGMTVAGHRNAGAVIQRIFDSESDEVAQSTLTLSSPGIPGTPATNDRFGAAVAAHGTAYDSAEVAIGAPGAAVAGRAKAGVIVTAYLPVAAGSGWHRLDQGTPRVAGRPDRGDEFGSSLTIVDTGGGADGEKILEVGVPFEDLGAHATAGAIERIAYRGSTIKGGRTSVLVAPHPSSGLHFGLVLPSYPDNVE